MAKNNVREKVKTLGMGLVEGLEQMESMEQDGAEEQKSNGVKEEKSKKAKKTKRSFMLTDQQIECLYLLKSKNPSMDLSEMVGQAIMDLYEKSKEQGGNQ